MTSRVDWSVETVVSNMSHIPPPEARLAILQHKFEVLLERLAEMPCQTQCGVCVIQGCKVHAITAQSCKEGETV
jgi:hypothetical protein